MTVIETSCKKCFLCDDCWPHEADGNVCSFFRPTTNFDKLREMNVCELAHFLANCEPCRESVWLEWLESEIAE